MEIEDVLVLADVKVLDSAYLDVVSVVACVHRSYLAIVLDSKLFVEHLIGKSCLKSATAREEASHKDAVGVIEIVLLGVESLG